MKFCVQVLLVFLLCGASWGQTRHFPQPPEAADKTSASENPPVTPKQRIDTVQLQREAREMLELSQSIQLDVNSVNHGLLPKDAVEKLKRIEKLAKHLRGEINP
jgi:hypothetical protein